MNNGKILLLDDLADRVKDLKSEGKRIVQCHGCFDVIHIGHIKHFQAAKKEGDVLIVTITPDRFVKKGPGRPYFNQELRAEQIAALECVDYVSLNKWETAVDTLKLIQPDVYVKGKEVLRNAEVDALTKDRGRKSYLSLEEEIVRSFGGRLHLTNEPTFSSSRIINEITESISDGTKRYLREFKSKYSSEEINEVLNSLKDERVLVIGDAIMDEYIFCTSMEKTGKEALVAHKLLRSELHLGGVFAVANHVAEFAGKVDLLTCIGKNHQAHIEDNINKKVNRKIFKIEGLETLVKTRYISEPRNNKVFEIYNTQEFNIDKEREEEIISYLKKEIDNFDIVLASDFGHGFMTPAIIEYLNKSKAFLAVNAQLNSGNLGYNFITKYPRVDFASLNERELRLPMQDKTGDIKIPMKKLMEMNNIKRLNITLAKEGAIYCEGGEFYRVPAFTTNTLDTIGAGDAFLAIGSMLAYKNVNPELVPFFGNAVGALAVKIMGNREPVKSEELKKFVSYILR